MASRVRIRPQELRFGEKLASLHWPFVALLLLIGCVGYLVLCRLARALKNQINILCLAQLVLKQCFASRRIAQRGVEPWSFFYVSGNRNLQCFVGQQR